MVAVSVRQNLKVSQALAPLLGSLCGRRIAKEKGDVNEADSEDGLSAFDVLAFVDQCGEGAVQMVELLQRERESQHATAAPVLTMCCKLLIVSFLTRASGKPYRVAASFSCSVVTLLVCKMRSTSLADS